MTDAEFESLRVQELAYQFWRQRGSPYGSPEEDWFRAEREVQSERRAEWAPLYALSLERDTR
jgi:hypothetical protein